MDAADAGALAELVHHQHCTHRDRYAHAATQLAHRWVWNQQQDEQLQAVQADWQEAVDRTVANWRGISAAQRLELLDQVLDAVDADDIAALTTLTVDTTDGASELGERMRELAEKAAQRMVDEAASQGVNINPATGDLDELDRIAAAIAALLGQGLALSAGREALRVRRPKATGAEVTRQVQEHLEELSDSTLATMVGGGLSNAQNRARIATLRDADLGPEDTGDRPVPAYYANETLDQNTCVNCEDIDGKWLGNDLDAVEEIYPNGGYRDCLGRERCRGTVVAVFRPETVDDF